MVVAAHPDDEVLGLGGTLIKHRENGDNISIMFMSDGVTGRDFSYDPQKRLTEINDRKDMALKAAQFLKCTDVCFLDLPNLRLDQEYLL